MKLITSILKSFRLLKEHQPWKLVLIFFLTLLTGLGSGLSIVLLIPLLQMLEINADEQVDGMALFFKEVADKAGVQLTIEVVLLVYLVLLTIMPLLQYWKTLLDANYQQTLIYRVRRRLFRKIIHAEWMHLNHKSKNNHLQVITIEVPNMADYYYSFLRMLMTAIMISSYILWALLISSKITLLIIIVGVILFFILRSFLYKAFYLGKDFVDSYSQLLKYIDDFWQTVKIAKVHSSEDFYYNKFNKATRSLLRIEYKMQKNHALPQLIYRVASVFMLVLIVYVGHRAGNVPLASFFILILLFSRIFPQLITLNTDVNFVISTIPSVEMVMKLDAEFSDIAIATSRSKQSFPVNKEIFIQNIAFRFPGGNTIFDQFTARIPAKQITGIIGESGRGKTTLIDIIAGLQKTQAGSVFVDGKLLDDELLPVWKRSIGYLPQDSFFIEGTPRENLVWDSTQYIDDNRIWEVLMAVNAMHLIKRLDGGLDEHVVNYHYTFSGGERQRLALARVLLREPSLLLLDEATSSLDADNEEQIMRVITSLKKQVTILFVTHNTTLKPFFDNIIQLDESVYVNGFPFMH